MSQTDFDIIQKRVLDKLQALDPSLTYHSIAHTLDVVTQVTRIGNDEGVNHKELYLLRIAALYHDSGFLRIYNGHEEKGCEIFVEDAHDFQFTEGEMRIISELIMATKMPQEPKNLLQKIICDADLDYLGRSDYDEIADKLKREFLSYKIIPDEPAWRGVQLNFLQHHRYHTHSSRLLRQPVKEAHIKNLS